MEPKPRRESNPDKAAAPAVRSPWSPFRHKNYAVIWTATVVANIGTWMYSSAAAWLMTTLDADPLMVSLVQVAASLPVFLFALPAGALADIVDKRHFLIASEAALTLLSGAFAAFVALGLITPTRLLLFTFLIETCAALTAPAWQSIVPLLVPREDLPPAVATNSVGINISRAIGPALGGAITVAWGIAAPFWINAVSNLGTIGALIWWRAPREGGHHLPAERFASAIRTGVRYARNNMHLRATLVRSIGFFLFASAYWALLPLVAREQIAGGAQLYGLLLGTIGASAIGGALALPWLKARLGPDRLVALATAGTAVTLFLYGSAREPVIAIAGSVMAGMSWIAALSNLNVSAQFALPEWVRGRGLAVYVTTFFGTMTVGSAIWGEVARVTGLSLAHYLAAAGALLVIPLTRRWKVQTAAGIDLRPSMHWPPPMTTKNVESDAGPVLVTVEYRVLPENRGRFLTALQRLARERRRDGAYAWDVYEDTAEQGRYLETFLVESWLEHLRQHERVTKADRIVESQVGRYLQSPAKISHFVAATPPSGTDERR
jgi:MFS family permease